MKFSPTRFPSIIFLIIFIVCCMGQTQCPFLTSPPEICELDPAQEAIGNRVDIIGNNFGNTADTVVLFGLETAFIIDITEQSGSNCNMIIMTKVPSGLEKGQNVNVVVKTGNKDSNAMSFQVKGVPNKPSISGLSRSSFRNSTSKETQEIEIYGENFGDQSWLTRVEFNYDPFPFNGIEEIETQKAYINWGESTDTKLTVTVPRRPLGGTLAVYNIGGRSNDQPYEIELPSDQDTDNDGIFDKEEVIHNFDRHLTNTSRVSLRDSNQDSDGDEIGHSIERFIGSDPWDADSPSGSLSNGRVHSTLRSFESSKRAVEGIEGVWSGHTSIDSPVELFGSDIKMIFLEENGEARAYLHPENSILFSFRDVGDLSVTYYRGVKIIIKYSVEIPISREHNSSFFHPMPWITQFEDIVIHRDATFTGYFVNQDEIRGDFNEFVWTSALESESNSQSGQRFFGQEYEVSGNFKLKRSELISSEIMDCLCSACTDIPECRTDGDSCRQTADSCIDEVFPPPMFAADFHSTMSDICTDVSNGDSCDGKNLEIDQQDSYQSILNIRRAYLCPVGIADCDDTYLEQGNLFADLSGGITKATITHGHKNAQDCFCQNRILIQGESKSLENGIRVLKRAREADIISEMQNRENLVDSVCSGSIQHKNRFNNLLALEMMKGYVMAGNNVLAKHFAQKDYRRTDADFFSKEIEKSELAYKYFPRHIGSRQNGHYILIQ